MADGIDNLAKLFEAKVIPRPSSMPDDNYQGHQFQFRQDLGAVLSVLNAQKGTENGPLSKTIYQDRPLRPLDGGQVLHDVVIHQKRHTCLDITLLLFYLSIHQEQVEWGKKRKQYTENIHIL